MHLQDSAPGVDQTSWRISVRRLASMPPQAWVLRARGQTASIVCGEQVRDVDGGVFEGSWAGEGGVGGLLESTTVFGSGVVPDGDELLLIPPSHHLEGIYVRPGPDGAVTASNSLVGLLVAAGLQLASGVDYPAIFAQAGDGKFRFDVPITDGTLTVVMYDGLRLGKDGSANDRATPRERPFRSFDDYRARLSAALGSIAANAPGYELVSTISSGYDSAAMSVIAREHGARRALTIAQGKPVRGSTSLSDSGEAAARAMGLEVNSFDRLAYLQADDLPEAEFLATGMSGEDVIFSVMGPHLERTVLVTGFFGDGMWWSHRPPRQLFWRLEQAGLSFTEFRLRVGFVHVPLPWFGASQMYSVEAISKSEAMEPWALGIDNDRPIARRILEEAGVRRGSFADAKRATSAAIHAIGPAAMTPASRASLEEFAHAGGELVRFTPKRFPRWRRFLFSRSRRLHLRRLAEWLEIPRRKVVRHQPEFGNLLLRWAVSVVAPRYRDVSDA